MVWRTPLPPNTKEAPTGAFFVFEGKGLANEDTGFNKFVRNKFEYLRIVQMTRRVEGHAYMDVGSRAMQE